MRTLYPAFCKELWQGCERIINDRENQRYFQIVHGSMAQKEAGAWAQGRKNGTGSSGTVSLGIGRTRRRGRSRYVNLLSVPSKTFWGPWVVSGRSVGRCLKRRAGRGNQTVREIVTADVWSRENRAKEYMGTKNKKETVFPSPFFKPAGIFYLPRPSTILLVSRAIASSSLVGITQT